MCSTMLLLLLLLTIVGTRDPFNRLCRAILATLRHFVNLIVLNDKTCFQNSNTKNYYEYTPRKYPSHHHPTYRDHETRSSRIQLVHRRRLLRPARRIELLFRAASFRPTTGVQLVSRRALLRIATRVQLFLDPMREVCKREKVKTRPSTHHSRRRHR